MTKPQGGRGKKASYETTQVRCPNPILLQVKALIEQFHNGTEKTAPPLEAVPGASTDNQVNARDLEKAIALLEECLAVPRSKHPSKAKIKEALECLKSAC